MGQSKFLIFSSKSLEKPMLTRIFGDIVANSSFCTSDANTDLTDVFNIILVMKEA